MHYYFFYAAIKPTSTAQRLAVPIVLILMLKKGINLTSRVWQNEYVQYFVKKESVLHRISTICNRMYAFPVPGHTQFHIHVHERKLLYGSRDLHRRHHLKCK